jgi:lon-related putative ATP-dependent protease
MGSEISGKGFNIIAVGLPGSGRTTLTREFLERKAAKEAVPSDWCYVNNFSNPRCPQALELPPGKAVALRDDLNSLIHQVKLAIPEAFKTEEYAREQERLTAALNEFKETESNRLQSLAKKYNFVIARTPFGYTLLPALEGQPLKPEDLEKLTQEQRQKLHQLQERLEEELKKSLSSIREMEKATQEKVQELDKRTAHFVVDPLIDELKTEYQGLDEVIAYLEAVQVDIVDNVDQFRAQEARASSSPGGQSWETRYTVNVIVDNSQMAGALVIVESHPTYHNLIGRIEHEFVMGVARTDFTMIRPGALHRANGGYLIVPARDVLLNPYAWEGLKRVLRDGCIRIAELGAQLGLIPTPTLEPEPIPVNTKVILIGTPVLYYLLRANDEDFPKLFKVRADFATVMDRTPDTEREYALFVKAVVDDNQLPSFDNTAVARIVEYGSRLAEDKNKLSTRFGKIADLIREAAYWAQKEGVEQVTGEAVECAIQESIYRNNLIEERIQEMIQSETILIDVRGEKLGQVNALSIALMGDYAFGRPSRVTASVYPGRGGVVDIERQAELGGPIHTKGVLIISGLLGHRYGQQKQLSLSASLTFEQTYEEVEGDSASAAEFFALLSALAEVPLNQEIAVTGSVNQHGQIQPVGGINEKIEGFFTTCKLKGLTGGQGVIIPKGNVRHLMLRQEVVQAVSQGKFHIWPISTIDEGIQLLTGMEPGEMDEEGTYPPGTFNRAIVDRLEKFAKAVEPPTKEEMEGK